MKHSLIILAGFLAGCLLAAAAPAQPIQLEDGSLLLARVQDVHDEGLVVERLDVGGVLRLRWSQLSRASQQRIKQAWGLSTDDESEVLVPAVAIDYATQGGGRASVVGRIVEETPTHIHVRRKGITYPVPRAGIKRRTALQVPASEIYTKDEFYNAKLAEISPGDDADKHILLADWLMRVRDYARAEAHLKKAVELGNSKQPQVLEGKLCRVQLFREAAEERALLDEIGVARARRDFARGRQLIAQFEERFPDSKLRAEFEREKQRFEKFRERYLVARVAEIWGRAVWTMARRKANDATVAFAQAREYAETQMGKDVRERVAKVLNLDAEEVDRLWAKRLEYGSIARSERIAYGVGSWTLGPDAIVKGTKQGEAEARPTSKNSSESRRIERIKRRIQEALERSRRAQARARGAKTEVYTEEDWWKEAKPEERALWLRAYYVEFGGDYRIEKAYVVNCLTCGGAGKLSVIGSTGKEQKVECPTCHGTRFRRVIRAR